MKVIGWLHNKFKHTLKASTESRSGFACLGIPGVEFKDFPTDVKLENEEDIKNKGTDDELFLGFLAIGTLGGELINTESPTPTFPSNYEDTTQEHKITENELKLISSKLEEFFEAEQEETASKTSARSSHASVITLSNYQTEETNSEETNTEDQRHMITCPLQKYLFGSSLELREAEMPIKKEKNSLGELFKRVTGHSYLEEIQENMGKKQAKEKDATFFLKKMLKKIHSVSVNTKTPPGDAGHGSFLKRKLPKVFKSFHKKVHPEGSMTSKELTKSCDGRFEDSVCKFGYQGANPTMVTDSPKLFSRTRSVPPTASKEHWIKTDTDYLVLEL